MKKGLLLLGFLAAASANLASAAIVVDSDWTVNMAIPQDNPGGLIVQQTFSGLSGMPISSVTVDLNISGGYNGDLYGYLVLQDANGNMATEILLNLMGTSPSNPFGSAGAGMNVTLSDAGTVNGSIHNAAGIPAGVWQPDSPNTLNGTFAGLTANGTWTLFLADLASGSGTSTLNSWGLEIIVAPEPDSIGLISGIGLLLTVAAFEIIGLRKRNGSQPLNLGSI